MKYRAAGRSLQHDDVLHLGPAHLQRVVHDGLERDFLALPVRDIGGEDDAGTAGRNPVPEGLCPESGEDHGVNRADSHARQHEDDRLGTRGHRERDAVALPHPEAAQGGRDPAHLVQELGVREDGPVATLVEVDQCVTVAVPLGHVMVQCVVGDVGLGAHEPAERRRIVLVDAVPSAEPRHRPSGPFPERFGISMAVLDPFRDCRRGDVHLALPARVGR